MFSPCTPSGENSVKLIADKSREKHGSSCDWQKNGSASQCNSHYCRFQEKSKTSQLFPQTNYRQAKKQQQQKQGAMDSQQQILLQVILRTYQTKQTK